MNTNKSAERIVILDFTRGKVFIEFVPMSMIEADANEIVISLESKLGIKESECQYMVVNDDDFITDNTL